MPKHYKSKKRSSFSSKHYAGTGRRLISYKGNTWVPKRRPVKFSLTTDPAVRASGGQGANTTVEYVWPVNVNLSDFNDVDVNPIKEGYQQYRINKLSLTCRSALNVAFGSPAQNIELSQFCVAPNHDANTDSTNFPVYNSIKTMAGAQVRSPQVILAQNTTTVGSANQSVIQGWTRPIVAIAAQGGVSRQDVHLSRPKISTGSIDIPHHGFLIGCVVYNQGGAFTTTVPLLEFTVTAEVEVFEQRLGPNIAPIDASIHKALASIKKVLTKEEMLEFLKQQEEHMSIKDC